MAFLQPDIVPAMAEGIHRQLRAAPGAELNRDTLQAFLLPGELAAKGTKVFTDTLRELTSIGAIEEHDGRISLPANVEHARDAGRMPGIIRERAMQAELASNLWEKDDKNSLVLTGARDLVRAAAWFLSLDFQQGPYEFERTTPGLSELQAEHTGERLIFNRERWIPFTRWTRYLGFTSDFPLNIAGSWNATLLPDPTKAIRPYMLQFLDPTQWTPVAEVIARLADALPVLDSGVYRNAVLTKGAPRAEADSSSSLSFAFKRLEAAGVIELDPGGGDATALIFANGLGAYHAMRRGVNR